MASTKLATEDPCPFGLARDMDRSSIWAPETALAYCPNLQAEVAEEQAVLDASVQEAREPAPQDGSLQ